MDRTHGIILVCLSLISLNAQAQDDVECYRHTDCDDGKVCINTKCTEPEEALQQCKTSSDCKNAVCMSGACKQEGVYCENPAGHCYFERDKEVCLCETGMGQGTQLNRKAEYVVTDAEMYAQCQTKLVEACGEQAPDSGATGKSDAMAQGSALNTKDGNDAESDSGCSVSSSIGRKFNAPPSSLVFFFGIIGIAVFVRRRR
jgi:hypothetical protein